MIHRRLEQLEKDGRPIRTGVIGAGTFGTQIITQACRMAGMRISAVAELDSKRARAAFARGGVAEERITEAETPEAIDRAIAQDRPVVTSSADALIASGVDVVIEATGNVEAGAKHGYAAIEAKKHLVMVTVEADVLIGYLLKTLADEAGVIYSLAYGDEPALAFELCDWARALGFKVIAAGKGTRFKPEFRKANPDDVPRLYGFTGKDYNAQMFCSFLDGTKHSIEMTALSNATGLVADVRGLHFPAVDLRDIPDKLCHVSKGGILATEGVVEAVSSMGSDDKSVERSIRGGLYAVIEGADAGAVQSLASYGEIIGMITSRDGERAMIYRPQHFIGHEMPISVVSIMLDGQPTGAPIGRFSEVVAAAKTPLEPGTILDGEGGFTIYGMAEKADVARQESLLPIGLSQGAEVIAPIPEDGMITYDNVKVPESFALELRRRQDAMT